MVRASISSSTASTLLTDEAQDSEVIGINLRMFALVWLPGLACLVVIMRSRSHFAHSLKWSASLRAMSHDGVNEGERDALRTLLGNVALLAALGASFAISFVLDSTAFEGVSHDVPAQIYVFASLASAGTFTKIIIDTTLTLLYVDQYEPDELKLLLVEQSTVLFVEPLLALCSALGYLAVSVLTYCGQVYGTHASLGFALMLGVAVSKIASLWTTLEGYHIKYRGSIDSSLVDLERRRLEDECLSNALSQKKLEDAGTRPSAMAATPAAPAPAPAPRALAGYEMLST